MEETLEALKYAIYFALDISESSEQRMRDSVEVAQAIERMIEEKIADALYKKGI